MIYLTHRTQRERWTLGLLVAVATVGMVGCASPPSVLPLLQVVDRALADEAELVQADAERVKQLDRQQMAMLDDAFEADLMQKESLDADWVRTHTQVYVLARESLIRQGLNATQAYDMRRRNLELARDAQRRAAELVGRQDELFDGLPDLRQWFQRSSGDLPEQPAFDERSISQ